jgi:hypothetical protein
LSQLLCRRMRSSIVMVQLVLKGMDRRGPIEPPMLSPLGADCHAPSGTASGPPGAGGARPLTPCPATETGRRLTVRGLQDRVGRLSTSGPPTSPDPHVARRWSLAPFLLPCRGSQPTGSLGEHHPPLTAAPPWVSSVEPRRGQGQSAPQAGASSAAGCRGDAREVSRRYTPRAGSPRGSVSARSLCKVSEF